MMFTAFCLRVVFFFFKYFSFLNGNHYISIVIMKENIFSFCFENSSSYFYYWTTYLKDISILRV